ncbi:MAG: hypothetical protein ACJAQZ_004353 [Planctomycetota bacterium]|jgi:hypothetical protein
MQTQTVANVAVMTFIAAASLHAQCQPLMIPGATVPGLGDHGRVIIEWDPDGSGPASPVIAIGGDFETAGQIMANRVVTFDPASGAWQTLGGGLTGQVEAMLALPNGDLIAAGSFNTISGSAGNSIARWNGTTWNPMGAGFNSGVTALARLPNGDIVAGGPLQLLGGDPADGIARWDGSSWNQMGAGLNGFVDTLAVMPNGDLIAAGWFTGSGSTPLANIARWDGNNWSAVSTGTGCSSCVRDLIATAGGDLIASGTFTSIGGQPIAHTAKWDGTTWSALGQGPGGSVNGLYQMANGDIVVSAGDPGTAGASRIRTWDGANWQTIGVDHWASDFLSWSNGDLFALGRFSPVGGLIAKGISRWDGTDWHPLATGMDGRIEALHALPNNDIVAGGAFHHSDAPGSQNIARFDGNNWNALGTGIDGIVRAITDTPNGDIIAGGDFTTASGATLANIARWDGTTWNPLGSGLTGTVLSLASLPNGDIIAGGSISHSGAQPIDHVAIWNGTSWAELGGGLPADVRGLTLLPNGNVVAATSQTFFESAVATWDGTSWQSPFGLFGDAYAVTTRSDGTFVAAGSFSAIGAQASLATWDGANWQLTGPHLIGITKSVAALPSGDIIVGGRFSVTFNSPIEKLLRWDGTSWATAGSFDTGFQPIAALALADQALAIGGGFQSVDNVVSPAYAYLVPTCAAIAYPFGTGCAGSAGVGELTAEAPWIGSTWTATATNLPALSLAVQVYGLSTFGAPLTAVFPQGLPGCNLLASPDFITVAIPVAGTAQSQLTLPSSASLVGQTFHHQVVPIEVNAAGTMIAVTSTNALTGTIGMF